MAALETQVPVLLIGIVLLAPFDALVSAESSKEKIQIGLLHPNPDNAGTNNEQSLQARGLFDSFGSLFNTAVWNTLTGPNNAKREVAEEEDRWEDEDEHDDHDDDEHVAEVTKGKGTSNSFNNFGTGKQNFHGASISIGGHDGDDGQDFIGAAIGSIGSINVGNNHNNGGIQRNGGISISGVDSANSINVGGNRNMNGIQTNGGVRIGSIGSNGISIGNIGADGISIGNIGSDGISINGGHIVMGGNIKDGISNLIFGNNYIQIDSNGAIIHVIGSGNHGLNMLNNKIYIGDKMICSIKTKSFDKPTYQKTPEGARWYTNVKVGTPMTPAEMAQFEKDWAAILQEQEETKKRLKKEAEERERKHKEWERQHKEQMDALDARLAREEEERERERKERERQQKGRMDALQARLKREADARARQQQEREKERERQQQERARQQEERARQQEERAKERERQQEERARQQEERERVRERQRQERERERERREQERMSWRQQRETRRTPSWNRGDSFSWW